MTDRIIWRLTPDGEPEFSHAASPDLKAGDIFEHVDGRTWTVAEVQGIKSGLHGTVGFATLTNAADPGKTGA